MSWDICYQQKQHFVQWLKTVRSANSISRVLDLQLKHINEINPVNLLICSFASETISLACFISIIIFVCLCFFKVYSWINTTG